MSFLLLVQEVMSYRRQPPMNGYTLVLDCYEP